MSDVFDNERIVHDMQQGTDEWHLVRKRKVTGSKVSVIATAKEGKALTQGAQTYMFELIGHYTSPNHVEEEKNSAACRWGHEYEPMAREEFSDAYDLEVIESGFIELSDNIGCSDDGTAFDSDGLKWLIEIKCPHVQTNHVKHIDMRLNNEGVYSKQIPSNYYWQCVYNSIICQCDGFYFVSFDPRSYGRHRMSIVECKLSEIEEDVKKIKAAVIYFVSQLENKLKQFKLI